jgi:hypothetical protein
MCSSEPCGRQSFHAWVIRVNGDEEELPIPVGMLAYCSVKALWSQVQGACITVMHKGGMLGWLGMD